METHTARVLGLWLAVIHLMAFGATVAYVTSPPQGEGWKSVVWVFWLPIDFPWSLLHFVMKQGAFAAIVDKLSAESVTLRYVLYSPHLIHGVIGTIWWGYLPTLWSRFHRRRQ